MNVKIGLSIVGISHDYDPFDGKKRRCHECAKNNQEMLIDPLVEEGKLKTYISTYDHKGIDEVVGFYKPTKASIKPIVGTNQLDTYLESLMLLRGEDLDLVVSTRFDILFKKKVSTIGFDYDKFNVLFEESGWKAYEFTDDNIFVFPYSMLNAVISSLENWKRVKPYTGSSVYGLHGLFHQVKLLVGEHNVKIVSHDEQKVDKNHFYRLSHKD